MQSAGVVLLESAQRRNLHLNAECHDRLVAEEVARQFAACRGERARRILIVEQIVGRELCVLAYIGQIEYATAEIEAYTCRDCKNT